MLNSSTIYKLNRMGFGLNIDKVEMFIHYFKYSRYISNLDKYEYNYIQLLSILKEVKPTSGVLREEYNKPNIMLDNYDKIFNKYGNKRCVTVYGKDDYIKLSDIKEENFSEEECTDLIAINNVEGINIMCTYINGRIYRIYAIDEQTKVYDFTAELKDCVPNFVEEFANYNLVELRGKATITRDKYKKFNSTACSVTYYLHNKINTSNISIIFDNILFEDNYEKFKNVWDKLEWLRDIGFNVPHHALIRNVDKIQFESALEEFDDFFRKINKEQPIAYDKIGFYVKRNKDVDSADYILCYDTDNVDYRTKFESTIKDICIDIDSSYVKVVNTKCNNGITIETIMLDDLYNIEKYGIAIGSKVNFIVVNGEAIIVNR